MSQKDWSSDEQRIQICYGLTEKKLLRVFNSHAPFRTRRAKLNKTPWINSALKKGVRCC